MHTRTWNLLVVLGVSALAAGPAFAGGGGKQAGGFIDREIKMMDTNGDKKLTLEEHNNGAKAMFGKMDTDKDGKVTATEMTAAHEQVTGNKARKSEMSAAEKIKVIDTNSDGALSEVEHTTGARLMFEKMDTDKDGLLTRSEIMAGHAKMLHHKGDKHHDEAAK
jgi:hypothetical protein